MPAFSPIYERFGILGVFVLQALAGALMYGVLSGASYLFFFVWGRSKFVPDHSLSRAELAKAMRWAAYSVVGNAALMLPFEYGVLNGRSRIYYDVAEHGWLYLVGSVVALVLITDVAIYGVHRALHHPLLFRRIHKHHHKFRIPHPWMSLSFHPLDSFGQALPYHVCAFLFPLHAWVYIGAISLVTLWAVLIHDRVSFVSSRFVNNTGCHTVHHWHNRYNLGQYFTFMDRLFGTYRSPASLPDRFFAAKWRDAPAEE